MSKTVLIMGESGAGKTTSMRNLNPEETFYIDCDRKGLNWKGWKEQYNLEKKNYMATSDEKTIMALLTKIDQEQLQVKNVIIDTLNWIMIDSEFKRMKEKSYDKWADLAYAIYNIATHAGLLRDDLNVIMTGHSQTDRDDSGYYFTKLKTSGKRLDKLVVESKLSTVLLAKCINGKYVFLTKDEHSTVKTPLRSV